MAARKFSIFILLSIAGCTLSIIICSVSFGTEEWYHGITKTITEGDNTTTFKSVVEINHGLFQGSKIKSAISRPEKYPLNVVCLASEGLCMFSCGKDSANREQDITLHFEKQAVPSSDTQFCDRAEVVDADRPKEIEDTTNGDNDPVFLNFALWLITLIFLGGAILFSLIGAVLGLYNTYSSPFQPILSVFGLYIWNGIAAGCILLTMIVWGIAFATNLSKTAAVSDTLSGYYNSDGNGSLGYSYWILLAAEFLNLGNIALLRYRTWKIVDAERNNTRVMDVKLTQGEILLF